MGFVYEERPSVSPFVAAVWRTEDTSNGTYLAAANGALDLIFTKQPGGKNKVILNGPSSQARAVQYAQGNRNIGVRFYPGVFLQHIPAGTMLDITQLLPSASPHRFWLDNKTWQLPTFDNIDAFIAKLISRGVLAKDEVVLSAVQGYQPTLAARSLQRRFKQATGLSPHYYQQIERANKAVEFLQHGKPILETAHQLGYTDQAHMTKSVKHLRGCTPGEIVLKAKRARRLYAIQGYGACEAMKVLNFSEGIHT